MVNNYFQKVSSYIIKHAFNIFNCWLLFRCPEAGNLLFLAVQGQGICSPKLIHTLLALLESLAISKILQNLYCSGHLHSTIPHKSPNTTLESGEQPSQQVLGFKTSPQGYTPVFRFSSDIHNLYFSKATGSYILPWSKKVFCPLVGFPSLS